MRPIVADVARFVVRVSVCPFGTQVNRATTLAPVETRVDTENNGLDGSAH